LVSKNSKPPKKVGTLTIKTIERRFQDVDLTDEDIADIIDQALTLYDANDNNDTQHKNIQEDEKTINQSK